jgi:hypothetical protein
MEEVLSAIAAWINDFFGPILRLIFQPIDSFLGPIYQPWATIVAVGYFVGTMVWVFIGLKRQYVNLEAPSKHVWHDLRFWVIVSMLPHVVVYLYF